MRDRAAVLEWLKQAPPGAAVLAAALAELLRESGAEFGGAALVSAPGAVPAPTWREKLHTVHPDTRLGVAEVCEGLGKQPNAIYKMCERGTIPCMKAPDRTWQFKAGELRAWQNNPKRFIKRSKLRAAG